MVSGMKNIDVRIWDMDDGKVTSLKIDDVIFPLVNPCNCFENDPFKVAHAFVEMFDIKHIRKNNTFQIIETSTTENNVSKTEDCDVIEWDRSINTKVKILKLLYNHFKDQDFTSDDVYKYTRGKTHSFGAISIYAYLKFIHERGCIKATMRYRDGIRIVYYRFIIPLEKCDLGAKTDIDGTKTKAQTSINQTTFTYSEEREPITENVTLDLQNYNLPHDLIYRTKNGLYITESKLLKLYYSLNPLTEFSVPDARKALKHIPGYSEPVIRACMSYLVNCGYATYVCRARSNSKIYTFLVPPPSWAFKKKPMEFCKSADVTMPSSSVKVDFDPEEVKQRRMLEIQTARGEA